MGLKSSEDRVGAANSSIVQHGCAPFCYHTHLTPSHPGVARISFLIPTHPQHYVHVHACSQFLWKVEISCSKPCSKVLVAGEWWYLPLSPYHPLCHLGSQSQQPRDGRTSVCQYAMVVSCMFIVFDTHTHTHPHTHTHIHTCMQRYMYSYFYWYTVSGKPEGFSFDGW